MSITLYNSTGDRTTTMGAGPLTGTGVARHGLQTPAMASVPDAVTTIIRIQDSSNTTWEVCQSTISLSGGVYTYSRGALIASSTGSRIDFSTGTKDIIYTVDAADIGGGGGGGGVTSVVAGQGIAVDSSTPSAPVVSAGTYGTVNSANGTVNNLNGTKGYNSIIDGSATADWAISGINNSTAVAGERRVYSNNSAHSITILCHNTAGANSAVINLNFPGNFSPWSTIVIPPYGGMFEVIYDGSQWYMLPPLVQTNPSINVGSDSTNNALPAYYSYNTIAGATGAFNLNGIKLSPFYSIDVNSDVLPGCQRTVFNASGHDMTIKNAGTATGNEYIVTGTGTDVVIHNNGSATFVWDFVSKFGWILVSYNAGA